VKVPKLTDAEIQSSLSTINGWTITGGDTLTKTFTFADFVAAIAFVNHLAEKAEAANHHPDLDIRYNKVTVRLSTHDSGGITVNDFTLAKEADSLA
jgi:4a-hydroxytetrahydrobiopterin dehydratase